jgi:hypothetical protein
LDSHRLSRVGLRTETDQFGPVETIWEGEAGFFANRGTSHLIDGRYVVGASAGVIDARTDEVIHDPNGDLLDVDEGRVLFRSRTDRGVFAFDPQTRMVERARGVEGKYGLPGVRSPDGTKSVEDRGSELILHRLQQGPRSLGENYHVHQSPASSNSGNPPVLWLDDSRILTQTGNGQLVIVAMDGTQTPVVTLPAKTEIVGAPRLERDPRDRIIYTCGDDGFVIEVGGRKWERCEWIDLGHGFEASWSSVEGRYMMRYRGEEIGRCPCGPHRKGCVATADGLLAVIAVVSSRERVQVWSANGRIWSTLELDRITSLIGWTQ